MAVIYLQHPEHGQKVACTTQEADYDRANGWLDFDPVAAVKVVAEVIEAIAEVVEAVEEVVDELPDFLKPAAPAKVKKPKG